MGWAYWRRFNPRLLEVEKLTKSSLFATLIYCATCVSSFSQDVPGHPPLIQMNTRIFDLRTGVGDLWWNEHFIPLTEIDWLEEVIVNDKNLHPTVVHIKVRPQPIVLSWPSLEPDRDYPLTNNIPPSFIIDAYQT